MLVEAANRVAGSCIYTSNDNNNNNGFKHEFLMKRIFDTFAKDLGLTQKGKFTGGALKPKEEKFYKRVLHLWMKNRHGLLTGYLHQLLRNNRSHQFASNVDERDDDANADDANVGDANVDDAFETPKRVFDTATSSETGPPRPRGKFFGNDRSANWKYQ